MQTDLVITNPAAAHGIYGVLGDQLVAKEPPLWARLLAGYIRDRGHSVAIIDAEAENLSAEETASRISEIKPRLICIATYGHMPSASTQQMFGAREVAEALKDADNDAPVIIIGGHPSALPEQTFREEYVDFVGVGEGPLTLLGLLRGDPWDKIPGLVYRDYGGSGEIVLNKTAPLIEDLGELRGDAWDLLPMDKYRAHQWQCLDDLSKRQPYASIYTSLGCSFKCSFCCINAPFASNRYRMRPPKQVVDEIEMLRSRYGITVLKITDEMFVLNRRHYTAICEDIIARGLGDDANIWAYGRIDTIKPDTLAMMRKAGIRWLALGIESGSKYVRDGAEKHLREDDIVGVVRAVQDAGIHVIGNFMFGLKHDSLETMQQTLDLALDCLPDWANFYSTMCYPGSALYDEAIKNGWEMPPDWRSYSQHNDSCTPMATEHVDSATVLKFRDDAFNSFFGGPRYLSYIERKFGAAAKAHVELMLTYKLKRKLTEAA